VKAFLHTNVLVYALSADTKSLRAQELLNDGGIVNVQVMYELVNVPLRKLYRSWPAIEEALDDLGALLDPPVPVTMPIHRSACWLARDHGFGFYDALILAAAMDAGCDTLLTEDMQDGRQVLGLTILNPFRC
jgi:predicted nucleic acid-binding protein